MIKKYNVDSIKNARQVTASYGKVFNSTITQRNEDKFTGKKTLSRTDVTRAIETFDRKKLIEISNTCYRTNPSYSKIIDYCGNIMTYYWMITPEIKRFTATYTDEDLDEWWNALTYVESINPEVLGPKIAKKVLLDGAAFVAVKEAGKKTNIGIQFLPVHYCRVSKTYLDRDVVDFNMRYFDDQYPNKEHREEVLSVFPKIVSSKYEAWVAGGRKENQKWQTLDPDYSCGFSLNQSRTPYFIGVVLDLLDLQDTKDITMFKIEQELSKILVQKFGITSDGVPIVDEDILRQFHSEMSNMLSNIPGVEGMTTYADVETLDLSGSEEISSDSDPVSRSTRNFYDAVGVSQLLFNADNSGTMAKSVVVDEAFMTPLVNQFASFLKSRLSIWSKKNFIVSMPPISIFNKSDMSSLYKEHTTLGYSKFLSMIALGSRQKEVMSSLVFESSVLEMTEIMTPPQSSNTMSFDESTSDEVTEKTVLNKENL